jgi:hypothetical protein
LEVDLGVNWRGGMDVLESGGESQHAREIRI